MRTETQAPDGAAALRVAAQKALDYFDSPADDCFSDGDLAALRAALAAQPKGEPEGAPWPQVVSYAGGADDAGLYGWVRITTDPTGPAVEYHTQSAQAPAEGDDNCEPSDKARIATLEALVADRDKSLRKLRATLAAPACPYYIAGPLVADGSWAVAEVGSGRIVTKIGQPQPKGTTLSPQVVAGEFASWARSKGMTASGCDNANIWIRYAFEAGAALSAQAPAVAHGANEAFELCAEEIERGEPWISREAASAIIRKHARALNVQPKGDRRPEFILSAMGDMVFDGDEDYDEMLESLREEEAHGDERSTRAPAPAQPPQFWCAAMIDREGTPFYFSRVQKYRNVAEAARDAWAKDVGADRVAALPVFIGEPAAQCAAVQHGKEQP